MQTLVAKKAVECEATTAPVAVVEESDLKEKLRVVREKQKSILKKEASLLADWQDIGLGLLEIRALIPRGQWEKVLPVETGIGYRTIQRYIQLYECRDILPEGSTPTEALKYLNGLNRKPKAKEMKPAAATSVATEELRQEVEDLYQDPETEVKWQRNGSAVAVERPGKTTVFPTPESAIAAAKKAAAKKEDQPTEEDPNQDLPENPRPKAISKPVTDDVFLGEDEAIAKLKFHIQTDGVIFDPFSSAAVKAGFPSAISAAPPESKLEADFYLDMAEYDSWQIAFGAIAETDGSIEWVIAMPSSPEELRVLQWAIDSSNVAALIPVEWITAKCEWLQRFAHKQDRMIFSGDRVWIIWSSDRDWNHPGFTCPFIY